MKTYDTVIHNSANFEPRTAPIVGIVVHAMGCHAKGILDTLTLSLPDRPEMEVSAHYIIPREPGCAMSGDYRNSLIGHDVHLNYEEQAPVLQVVHPRERAWHAGASKFSNWNGINDCGRGLNNCTIGIEFEAPGYGAGKNLFNFVPFTNYQRDTAIALIADLVAEYHIPPQNIVAHSTIAPSRKTDPGPLFFWKDLHDAGLGYLPTPVMPDEMPDILTIQQQLFFAGFTSCPQDGKVDADGNPDTLTQQCIDAYRMQFASEDWEGEGKPITEKFIASLNGFKKGVFGL